MKNAWKSRSAGAALIMLLTVVAYFPALHCGFIWDDADHLTENPVMTAPHGLQMIWSSLAFSRYYPLTLTTYWAEHRLWGLNPLPYHLVNVVLHAINGVLIFLVLRRLRVTGAWLAAMLWTLHPVNVESVAWITELKNTQSGVFFFLALLCFLRFDAHERRHWYALALLCGLAAMLSKPSTVVLPLVLLLCAWWERGRLGGADIVRTSPFFGLALMMSALTIIEQRGHIARESAAAWSTGMPERFAIAGKAVWFYAAKLLWPANLAFVYPSWEVTAKAFSSWLPLGGVIAVGVVLWVWRRQRWARAGIFGLGFFVTALLPVLGFFDVFYFRYSFVADHFQYLASIGVLALPAACITMTSDRVGRARPWLLPTLGGALLLLSGALSWRQTLIYSSSETLWRGTLKNNPGAWMAHSNLGSELANQGRVAEAVTEYAAALRIKPDYPELHSNLGNVLASQGRIEEAVAEYATALRINPDCAEAHNNWGLLLAGQGKLAEATAEYQAALRIKPDSVEAHNNLGSALANQGKTEEAVAEYAAALRINPDYAEAHYNLGAALASQGKLAEATAEYATALRINPDYAEAHNNLGNVLAGLGRVSEAITEYSASLRINPDNAEAHYNLGVALAGQGKVAEAISEYAAALRIKPGFAEAHNSLGAVLAGQAKISEAMTEYREALRLRPDWPLALRNLAWLLAAFAPAEGGDPILAVTLAQRACKLTGNRVPAYLDTLAAAYAAIGRFNDAVATAQKAMELARSAGQTQLAGEMEARLQLYRSGRAYYQSVHVTSPRNP